MFKSAEIMQISDNIYRLEINYCWYFLMDYTETFVYDSLDKAKTKLLTERSNYRLKYIDSTGKEKNLDLV
jgi:hypothetical protein